MNNNESNSQDNNNIEHLFEELEKAFREDAIKRYTVVNYKTTKESSTIAQNIKQCRTNSNLSQEELAERLNVDRGTIINWESGKSCPNGWQIEDLAKIFNIDISELHTKQLYKVVEDNKGYEDYLKREKEYLERNPDNILNKPIKPGTFCLWEGDLARDYVWITRHDLIVIAAELIERGYCVTTLDAHNFDLQPSDFHYPLELVLLDGQEKTIKTAISEALASFANNTSKYEDVIELRRKLAISGIHMDDDLDEILSGTIDYVIAYELTETNEGKGCSWSYDEKHRFWTENLIHYGKEAEVKKKICELQPKNFEIIKPLIEMGGDAYFDIDWGKHE